MKKVEAIKRHFESEPNGRKVTMDELKELSKEERQELAEMAAALHGWELDPA